MEGRCHGGKVGCGKWEEVVCERKSTGADLPTDGLLVYALEAEALERGEGKGGEAETLLDRVAEQRDGKAQRSSESSQASGICHNSCMDCQSSPLPEMA